MKKHFLVVTLICFSFMLHGQISITMNDAVSTALRFANREYRDTEPVYSLSDVVGTTPIIENGDTLLFFVRIGDSNIVVSRLKCFPPILACFKANGGISCYPTNCPGADYFIQRYCENAKFAIRNKVATISPRWEQLFSSDRPKSDPIIVPPLLTTIWGQNETNDGTDLCAYNYYVTESCSNCNCNISAVGCVAVAIGQIMNYWKYPVVQLGKSSEHQFDWCNMPNSLYSNPNYYNDKVTVARLLRDCGVACNMNYCFLEGITDDCQSFAWPSDAKNALVDTFNYSTDAFLAERNWNSSGWKQMLIDELTNSRPVFYASMSNDTSVIFGWSGHAFVCDGYDETQDMFHFNFGWNGLNDGHFDIDNLIVGNDNYNTWTERAIFKIHPPSETCTDYCNNVLSLYEFYNHFYGHSGESIPAPYANVPSTATILYSVPDGLNAPASWNTIPNGVSSKYIAHHEISLLPGFSVERGANFVAKIEPCANCENTRDFTHQRASTTTYNLPDSVEQQRREDSSGEPFDERENMSMLPIADNDSEHNINVYPNPTEGQVAVEIPQMTEGKVSIQIMDIFGRQVLECHEDAATGFYRKTIDASSLPSGCYYVVVTANENRNIKCIIKQ